MPMARVLSLVLLVAVSADPTRVTTPSGTLQGFLNATNGLCAFRGIPYAKPPLGDLRWP